MYSFVRQAMRVIMSHNGTTHETTHNTNLNVAVDSITWSFSNPP